MIRKSGGRFSEKIMPKTKKSRLVGFSLGRHIFHLMR